MARFEVISKYATADLAIPVRKTEGSAGYDLAAAEDIIIPPYSLQYNNLIQHNPQITPIELADLAALTKQLGARPTLVPTGLKCKLDPGTYLELSVRSSTPLKYWITLANGVGIIDQDYYNNPDNEGHIFLQMINWSPYPIHIPKGEAIGQGIIKNYLTTEDDIAQGERLGGFGSTNG